MIVLYKGARGRGKNLSMVKDAFLFYKNGYKILANFSLAFGNYISSEEVLALDKSSDLFHCVLVLDEIQLFFDSRNFAKKENKDFSNFIQQIRKRDIIILCATQYSNTIDLRLRQHIDIVAFPTFDEYTNLCTVKYFDLTVFEDLEFSESDLSNPITVIFDAKQVFDLYDTMEMLK